MDREPICRDFNPPHLHRGNISGVGYLKIPSSIRRNEERIWQD